MVLLAGRDVAVQAAESVITLRGVELGVVSHSSTSMLVYEQCVLTMRTCVTPC